METSIETKIVTSTEASTVISTATNITRVKTIATKAIGLIRPNKQRLTHYGVGIVLIAFLSACGPSRDEVHDAGTPDSADNATSAATQAFEALLEETWEWELQASPTFATSMGDPRFNDRWEDISFEGFAARQQWRQDMLQRLARIDVAALDADNQLNYELFRRTYQQRVEGSRFETWLMPLSHRGGIQTADQIIETLKFNSEKDYQDWLARLSSLDEQIMQTIELMELGIEKGLVQPKILLQRLPAQIEQQLVEDARGSPFFKPFEKFPEQIDAQTQQELATRAEQIIGSELIPAYRKLKTYVEETYIPASRDSIAAADLPNGRAYYEFQARNFTTTDMTPDEIHAKGLTEVKRIRAEMQKIIEQVGFKGDFNAFVQFLRTDPQFYFDDPQDLLNAYRATSKQIDPELVKLFGKLPAMPYGVIPIPDAIAPDTTTAYYNPPTGDGSRAGYYYVNLYQPESRPKYEIEVLTVHEAMPGHHLQIALAQELPEVPMFRRFLGFTAFVEGWGLYSESLGEDLGLYKDPYSKFGQLTYEMWRAIRLVVDTGMHYKGWSRAQAIEFFKQNAAKSELDIVNEIDRYIGWPGQALAYKIGELKIKEIKANAQAALGESFDIRAFHDELLGGGALPLDILEQRMNKWVASQKP